jgi:acyl-CoA reductase-like NAD-dependent aldehyde dehydrogenase
MSTQSTVSPVDGRVCVERKLATDDEVAALLEKSHDAFLNWRTVPVEKRVAYVLKMVEAFVSKKDEIAKEITIQMGRPIRYTGNEVNGFAERSKYMARLAVETLKDKEVVDADRPGFKRYIRREPLGTVLVIPAWNYPLLTAVNGIVPAILAGNCVVLKHSQQTPLCAERIYEAFKAAGLPEGVFQFVHMNHTTTEKAIKNPFVQFVNFTGSVQGGRSIYQSVASSKFIGCGLELGGKDPAYVREDADLHDAIETLVDGSMFNSGQCCCGIERIYVHEKVYDEFVNGFVEVTKVFLVIAN